VELAISVPVDAATAPTTAAGLTAGSPRDARRTAREPRVEAAGEPRVLRRCSRARSAGSGSSAESTWLPMRIWTVR